MELEADRETDNVYNHFNQFVNTMETYQNTWFGSLILNVAIYGLLIIPGWFFIKYYKRNIQRFSTNGPLSSILKSCILGNPKTDLATVEEGSAADGLTDDSSTASGDSGPLWKAMQLCGCILGLQVSYLTWGVIQERIMTKSYDGGKFTNSQFLVLINRILALMTAGLLTFIIKQPPLVSPFYKYSFSSISNILSSWCQYEALKFISFPTQVLAKSCKVIPVMVMGKAVSNKTYPLNEYVTALMISVGVSVFLLSSDPSDPVDDQQDSKKTTIAGVIILCGYLIFDSFTSNWQSELFKVYKMSSLQMMFGINLFSFTFTTFSLIVRGTIFSSLSFLVNNTEFAIHVIVLSICSATGQLFIFYTISSFGPVVFTLIMTSRQAVSIIISCIIYGHKLSLLAVVGVVIVFMAILLRVYLKQRSLKK